MEEEKSLFRPYIAGYLGKSESDVQNMKEKIQKFQPIVKVFTSNLFNLMTNLKYLVFFRKVKVNESFILTESSRGN